MKSIICWKKSILYQCLFERLPAGSPYGRASWDGSKYAMLRQTRQATAQKQHASGNCGGVLPTKFCDIFPWPHNHWFGERVFTTRSEGTDSPGIVPSVICAESSIATTKQDAVTAYRGDLRSPELVDMQIARWKAVQKAVQPKSFRTRLLQQERRAIRTSFRTSMFCCA